MTSNKQSFPYESGAASIGWGNTTAAGDPTVDEVELDNLELSSYSTVREDTLADARSDIVGYLLSAMGEAAAQEIDNQAFNGTGSLNSATFYGLLSSRCGYSVVMAGTAFSGIAAGDLSSMIAKLDGLRKQGARFFMNGAVLHFIRTLADDNSRPIFMDNYGSTVPATIFGYPYSEVIKMTGTTASNTAFVAFGNMKYYAIGRRIGGNTLKVDPYGLFTTNRIRYKLYQRWAFNFALRQGFARLLTHS
jgi:HK97 family phage major capsid protein